MLKAKQAHFIGIGGIGVSAIAKMMLGKGVSVSGSDSRGSDLIESLIKLGATISLEHNSSNIRDICDLVVYSNAIAKDNPELVSAREKGVKTLSYPEVLGEISKDKFTIAISGNAGKTTTTALLGEILINSGLNPTIIVGSLAYFSGVSGDVLKTNFVSGEGKYFLIEADEYKRAFLNLEPRILAINNIEEDHLDYYKDLLDIQNAFKELTHKVPKDGFIICNTRHKNVLPVLNSVEGSVVDYSLIDISDYSLNMPGKHNRENIKVAVAIATILGIDREKIKASIEGFKGVWRRFEYKGNTKKGSLLYDDYAHNPQKIEALISGAKEKFPDKKIVIIFQPHLFSRTQQMLGELAESLSGADRVIVTPIYAAREVMTNFDITHRDLADGIADLNKACQVEVVDSLEEIKNLIDLEDSGSICVTVGAGDIYTVATRILN